MKGVLDFLTLGVIPQSTGAAKFHGRVAANALSIAHRMAQSGPQMAARQAARLDALGHSETSLYNALFTGDQNWRDPSVLDHLRLTTLERITLHQPKYAAIPVARMRWTQD